MDFDESRDHKPLILIVDDVPKNLQILGNILKEIGCEVSAAVDGEGALKIVEDLHPDLVLLDIMMPDMDGFDVCNKFKQMDKMKNVPIIFLTAKADSGDIVKGFEVGAVDYVTKPFNNAELIARVKTHLELKFSKENLEKSYSKLKESQSSIIELEKKNSALAMAVTASHEINQPLMILEGNLEMLRLNLGDDVLTDKNLRYFSQIEIALERIQKILKKFHDSDYLEFDNYAEGTEMAIFNSKN